MAQTLAPKLKSLRVRGLRVPMQHLHPTASGGVAESPLVLTDAIINDGMTNVNGATGTGVAWNESAVERFSVWILPQRLRAGNDAQGRVKCMWQRIESRRVVP